MGCMYAKDVVDIALNEVGYQCGDNKWNKYADDLDRVDYFTGCGKKQNLDFCAVGLCWCLWKAAKYPSCEEDGDSAKWTAHFYAYQSDNCDMAAVVKYLYQYFADNGATTDNPERGDLVIFQKSNGVMYHCGLVTRWDNDYIYITEFNTEGGQVKTHSYEYSDIGGKIKCFCRPRYDGWEESATETPTTEPAPEPTPDPEPQGEKYTVCNVTSFLNVRSGPGKQYPSIWKLYNDEVVTIYEIKDGWGRIDDYGWVCMDYLK